jgi:hypothetical protein
MGVERLHPIGVVQDLSRPAQAAPKGARMTYVVPEGMRSVITPDADSLIVEIPVKRNWFQLLFLSFWLCGWAAGEVMVPVSFFSGKGPPGARLFTVAWLGMWTVGGAFAIYAWLWQIAGKEIIRLTSSALIKRRAVNRFGRDKEFSLAHVRNLRVVPSQGFNPFDFASAGQLWGLSGGSIAFDYGARTYRFGQGVDESEAKSIVSKFKERVRIPES